MLKLFCGYESRESAGFHTFVHSVLSRASKPVSIIPLARMGLPAGSNAFTLSRFLVPMLCNYEGRAIFADASDMLMLGDIAELDALYDHEKALQVVQHPDYVSLHPRKYIGTEMECDQTNYARKNQASLMIFNCAHRAWRGLDFQSIEQAKPLDLLQFSGLHDAEIGALPAEWNVLIDEGQDDANAKIIHFTAGVPWFKHYQNARRSKDWFAEYEAMSGIRHG